ACRSELPRVAHRESEYRQTTPERARRRDRADQGHAAFDPAAAARRLARRSHQQARRRAGARRRRRAVSLPGAGAGRGGPGDLAVFLRNSWYVAAWDREIGRRPLATTFLHQPVVLYRKEDGP